MYELTVEESFSAAHQLFKSKTPCENLHGHNWRVQVVVRSEQLDTEVGWVVDFKEIKTALKEALANYDHQILNDVLDCSPTAENLARSIYFSLKPEMPVARVTVWETERASASYYE